ncbi:Protein S100-A12 [Tupaia chinensis]|uniref:Protein S100 n=1 Tax=Tupaia chinensis TaxID=246437 RepID=L9J9Q9_TUPCH|nr:Protein S100-A12 [Tupaia chinensis]
MSKMEDHMEGIINIFHQYSVRVGDFDTLSKGELKRLITKELPNTLKVVDTPHIAPPAPCTEGEWRGLKEDGGIKTGVGWALVRAPKDALLLLWNTKDKAAIDKLFQDLDADKDGQLSFDEFMVLVISALKTVHKEIHQP